MYRSIREDGESETTKNMRECSANLVLGDAHPDTIARAEAEGHEGQRVTAGTSLRGESEDFSLRKSEYLSGSNFSGSGQYRGSM